MKINNFNCKICNFEEKTYKTDFCKTCNFLKCIPIKIDKELKSITNNGLKKLDKRKLFQKKYKAEYLLKLRRGFNLKTKRSSMDLEYLYNDIEIFLKRDTKINITYHCVNQFNSLPLIYKSFIYSSLSHILFDSVKKYYPNNIWFLLRNDCPWEN